MFDGDQIDVRRRVAEVEESEGLAHGVVLVVLLSPQLVAGADGQRDRATDVGRRGKVEAALDHLETLDNSSLREVGNLR